MPVVDHGHAVTQGIGDTETGSEQYCMQVDPSAHVLATTTVGLPDPVVAVAAARRTVSRAGRQSFTGQHRVAAASIRCPALDVPS